MAPISKFFTGQKSQRELPCNNSPALLEEMKPSSSDVERVIISAKFEEVPNNVTEDEVRIAMFVTDASGSMSGNQSTMQKALKDSASELAKLNPNAFIMEARFADDNITSKQLILAESYQPSYKADGGGTNLYDAILWAIARAKDMKRTYRQEQDVNAKINVCVFTDGLENYSKAKKTDVIAALNAIKDDGIPVYIIACGVGKEQFRDLGIDSRYVFECNAASDSISKTFARVSQCMSKNLSRKF